MKWKIQLVGNEFDLKELERSFSNSDSYSITKENDGYYFSSNDLDLCQTAEEVKKKFKDILGVLNGLKALVIGSNSPIKYGSIVKEKTDGPKEIIMELLCTVTVRDSFSIAIKNSEGGIIKEVHSTDVVPEWLTIGLHDEQLKDALRIYGKQGDSLHGLYKVYEIIEDAVGGKEKIIEQGWASRHFIKRFKYTANNPDVSGDEARHGKRYKGNGPKRISTSEARSFIKNLLIKYLNLKYKDGKPSNLA